MALGSFLRRSVLPLMISTTLVACSAEGLVPRADIDNRRVSAIAPVTENMRQPRTDSQQPYPASSMPVSDAAGIDDPVAAEPLAAELPPQKRRLPMIDSDEAASDMGVQPLRAPEEGVNMDAELGVAPVVGLAEEQSQAIAKGSAAQPVVDGIGSENPTQLSQPQALPQSEMQQEVNADPVWGDQSRVIVPRKGATMMADPEAQQIAMLPRANNPMSVPEEEPAPQNVMSAADQKCRVELKKLGVKFAELPPISNGPTCAIPFPIKLQGLSGGIIVKPATTLNCPVTLAFAKWVKYELTPSARSRYWSGIKTIVPLGGYSCRRMNSSSRNPWSEHAHGNAIDVGKFVLNSGKEIDVRKKGFFAFREKALLKAVRTDSCKYFSTVLGPGSDPHHKDHFHFDLRTRKSGYQHCD